MTTGFDRGRPKRVPFAWAAAMPALTRSAMSSRSYSASVASAFAEATSARRLEVLSVEAEAYKTEWPLAHESTRAVLPLPGGGCRQRPPRCRRQDRTRDAST